MTNFQPSNSGYYNRVRINAPNTKKSRSVSLPFVTILANHKDYRIRESATGPVLKSCKPVKVEL